MNKKNIIIYSTLALVLFFGIRQTYKPKAVYQPNVQVQDEVKPSIAASSTKLEQKIEPTIIPIIPTETKLEVLPILNNKIVEKASASVMKIEPVILLDMAFTTQAPFAEWSDPRQQDACEEAAALMAVRWAQGKGSMTKAEAKKQILAIVAFEKKKHNNYRDTSAADTLKIIIKEYFAFQNAELKKNSNLTEIKQELGKGNTLILPMDGRKLKNPNFSRGGPDRHNIVIRGYDPVKKEFITNDPGTRRGEGYRYPEKIIEAAWRDYPTGDHEPIVSIEKNMIVVMPIKNIWNTI